ncbi:MAG: LCP family protein [Candidatus Ancillula sp.]|jgi:LCP family protein required for cell wall assembly|nr:LCP family protein [Candidatus Ancillula sp.]
MSNLANLANSSGSDPAPRVKRIKTDPHDKTDSAKNRSFESIKVRNTDITNLEYDIKTGANDEKKNIVRIEKTYHSGKRKGEVKVNRKGFAKCKVRVQKFKRNGMPVLKRDGNFKLAFTNSRRFLNALLIFLFLALIAVTTLAGIFYFSAEKSLNQGSIQGSLSDVILKNDPLQTDDSGRTNIAILGTSEDDVGHDGDTLVDSIMILSINVRTGAANAVSIPRDLTYKDTVPSGQRMCSAGIIWKLNTGYMCGMEYAINGIEMDVKDPNYNLEKQRRGARYMADILEKVTGLQIQYYVKVDYTVVSQTVDVLGGIDVIPYSDDPRGIWDWNMELKIPTGLQHLDGATSLKLARARNDNGAYGLARSNFDREINQQIVIAGIREKAANSGILLNPLKILELSGALGSHIVTNFKTSELRSLGQMANLTQNIVQMPLLAPKDNPSFLDLVVAGGSLASPNLGSVVLPVAGEFDFTDIKKYIRICLENNGANITQASIDAFGGKRGKVGVYSPPTDDEETTSSTETTH